MTPEYASPEQVRSETVTTVSDIYSLGVILYKLLTGRSPYVLGNHLPHELERAICEVDPVKPSSAVGQARHFGSAPSSSYVPARSFGSYSGESSPETVRRQLRGDLDNIVLKALSKEPSLRYVSAEALNEDLRRYLAGEPVSAHPSTVAYRTVKFVRRNRGMVGVGSLLLISLLGGMIATHEQAVRADQERQRAERNLREARRERARADQQARIARQEEDRAVQQARETDRQRVRAEAQTHFARLQRASAIAQREEAERQRTRAEQRFNDVRKLATSL